MKDQNISNMELSTEAMKQIAEAVNEMSAEQFRLRLAERTQRLRALQNSVTFVSAQVKYLISLCPHRTLDTQNQRIRCLDCGQDLLTSQTGDSECRTSKLVESVGQLEAA